MDTDEIDVEDARQDGLESPDINSTSVEHGIIGFRTILTVNDDSESTMTAKFFVLLDGQHLETTKICSGQDIATITIDECEALEEFDARSFGTFDSETASYLPAKVMRGFVANDTELRNSRSKIVGSIQNSPSDVLSLTGPVSSLDLLGILDSLIRSNWEQYGRVTRELHQAAVASYGEEVRAKVWGGRSGRAGDDSALFYLKRS